MIKPEQIPAAVITAFCEAWARENETSEAECLAAALNAWAGAFPHTFRGPLEGYGYVLPLPQENTDE